MFTKTPSSTATTAASNKTLSGMHRDQPGRSYPNNRQNTKTKIENTMKLTQKTRARRKSGMTLLELTVVILVLLSLISILFVGARAWKRGSDRSANILNIRNVQQAVRGHENMYQLRTDDVLASTRILGDADENYMRVPTPPADLDDYTYLDLVPAQGVLFVTNNADDEVYGFSDPDDYSDW